MIDSLITSMITSAYRRSGAMLSTEESYRAYLCGLVQHTMLENSGSKVLRNSPME
jgi:hypothetical protein